jgi:ABC-type transport system involved in cytochrome c biogenesis permease subunit
MDQPRPGRDASERHAGSLASSADRQPHGRPAPQDDAWKALAERWFEAGDLLSGAAIGLAPLAPDGPARAWVVAAADRLVTTETTLAMRLRNLQALPGGLTDAALADADIWIDLGDAARIDQLGDWPGPRTEIATLLSAWRSANPDILDAAARTAAPALHAWGQRRDAGNAARTAAARAAGLDASEAATFPTPGLIAAELFYGSARFFTWAWIAFIAGGLLVAAGTGGRALWRRIGYALSIIGCLATVVGLSFRVAITGMGAVTNLYETLIWTALLVAVLGLWFARRTVSGIYAVAGGVGAGLCAMIGEAIPPEYGSTIGQLQPVLRSQFWLWTHVKVVVAAYAPFLLAMVLGMIVLVRAAAARRSVTGDEQRIMYRCFQVGVVLMATGTILGAVWADQAWGRYWGWDPKEVYALIVVLVYLVPLHLRYVGWVGPDGFALWSVLGFQSVVMSWYGVNFLLGVGKHAYAFGSGGQWIVLPLCAIQTVIAIALYLRIRNARTSHA